MRLGSKRLLDSSNERKLCERFSRSFQDPPDKFQKECSRTLPVASLPMHH
jgi:hypothetical protein